MSSRKMRRLVLLLTLGLAFAPEASVAQTSKPRPERIRPTLPKPPAPPPSKPPALVSLAPPPRLSLTGLPPVGDASPVCRAQCTKDRVYCEASGDDCTPRWSACLAVCRAPGLGAVR